MEAQDVAVFNGVRDGVSVELILKQVRRGSHGSLRFLDLLLNIFEVDVEVGQDGGGDPFALTNEAEEDVLGADVFVVQPGRLFAGHLQHFADAIGKVVAVHRGILEAVA